MSPATLAVIPTANALMTVPSSSSKKKRSSSKVPPPTVGGTGVFNSLYFHKQDDSDDDSDEDDYSVCHQDHSTCQCSDEDEDDSSVCSYSTCGSDTSCATLMEDDSLLQNLPIQLGPEVSSSRTKMRRTQSHDDNSIMPPKPRPPITRSNSIGNSPAILMMAAFDNNHGNDDSSATNNGVSAEQFTALLDRRRNMSRENSYIQLMPRTNSRRNIIMAEVAEKMDHMTSNKEDAQSNNNGTTITSETGQTSVVADDTDEVTTTDKDSVNDQTSPQQLLEEMLGNLEIPTNFWDSYFLALTEARHQAYTQDLTTAVRRQDLEQVETLLSSSSETTNDDANACNAQGESLVHLAARRHNLQLIKLLVHQCQASLQVRDDYGKTPLHELCWTTPNNADNKQYFQTVSFVIQQAPCLLLAQDKRGFTPFHYIPEDAYPAWNQYLVSKKEYFTGHVVTRIQFEVAQHKLQTTLQLLK